MGQIEEYLYMASEVSCCSEGKPLCNLLFQPTAKNHITIFPYHFAYQLVEKGMPYFLSWGLQVGDIGATKFATVLYEELAKGKSIYYAVSEARQAIQEDYHPWQLKFILTYNFLL